MQNYTEINYPNQNEKDIKKLKISIPSKCVKISIITFVFNMLLKIDSYVFVEVYRDYNPSSFNKLIEYMRNIKNMVCL